MDVFIGDLPFDPALAGAGWGPPCAVGGCQGRALARAALAGPKMGLGPGLQVSLTPNTDEHDKMRTAANKYGEQLSTANTG
jgi:hypothetical protein